MMGLTRGGVGREGYFTEIRRYWRPLLAATLGISAGVGVAIYPQSILAPYLLKEFGWSRSEFAFLGTITLIALIIFPAVGRLVDLLGVRRVILPGVILYPLSWAAFSLMTGAIWVYVVLVVVQLFTGALVTSIVYSKIVAPIFTRSRGLALSLMMSGPAATGAILSPLLTSYVEVAGWRAGYLAVAAMMAVLGLAGYFLLPESRDAPDTIRPIRKRHDWRDYRMAFANPAFWIIFGGMAMCNIPNVLHTSQMAIMLTDRGLGAQATASAISAFALGVIGGRFACGLCLDRLPAELVAACTMILPAAGFFVLAVNVSAPVVIIGTMALVGLSQGAEGDIGAYLTAKYFDVENYGTIYGMIVSNAVVSTALGAGILSATLERTGSFTMFLFIGAFAVIAGSVILLALRAIPVAREADFSANTHMLATDIE